MTTLAWPTFVESAPDDQEWALLSNTAAFQSPLSGAGPTIEFPGARWKATMRFAEIARRDAGRLRAFMARLRGRSGRFTLHNHAHPAPLGTIAGTPLVKGAGQGGNTLTIDGCTPGTTLLEGDYIGVNGELKLVVIDATANAQGEMALTIEPPWRASPPDNAAVVIDRPTATFMLTEDAFRELSRSGPLSDIVVDCVEYLG